MAFQLGEDNDSGMNEMNLIPLIDIMLVLMIIFLVTATVANPSVPLTLPKTTAEIVKPPEKEVSISINADGDVAWNAEPISLETVQQRFIEEGKSETKPAIQLRADKDARYETVAKVMAFASTAGLNDIAFVSEN
ncbi:ExbD/TolR family protein [Acinetobacter larvae]|uniref:Biopolymer transporter ExbD n=1 Tax=Acinetobacter larvae TaxID=1789224 RepID=A0A1B2M319_9GAMM|nr:biopolymer transporter ExbD [Acinetobacter larvae]AOA59423.1 biopolymer transporter ExbD [Acinetobacter larvae]